MSDARTLKVYDAKANDYAALTDRDRPGIHLNAFITAMPKGARVLDLGCGPGQSAVDMQDAGLAVAMNSGRIPTRGRAMKATEGIIEWIERTAR